MTTEEDIGWGSYRQYEGAFFRGKIKYVIPINPDFLDKVLTVLTATEGGCYDAINMYDRCILSVGLIQWCEAFPQCSVSNMLGRCAELDPFMFDNQLKKFPVKVRFYKNKAGKHRFHVNEKEVDTQDGQRQLFFGSSEIGQKGTWTDESKHYAKRVAAWFANLWDIPLFRTVQASFTKTRIEAFAMPESRKILFGSGSSGQEGWEGALKAAYYSFAGNLPAVANKSIQAAASNPYWASADAADRFRIALQALTFGPGIDIYPHRYEAISPVLSRVFRVDIPATAVLLRQWGDAPPVPSIVMSAEEEVVVARANQLTKDLASGTFGANALDLLLRNVCED